MDRAAAGDMPQPPGPPAAGATLWARHLVGSDGMIPRVLYLTYQAFSFLPKRILSAQEATGGVNQGMVCRFTGVRATPRSHMHTVLPEFQTRQF